MIIIKYILISWLILCGLATALLFARKDIIYVLADIESYFQYKNNWLKMLSFVLIVIILPFSIPYSIAHLIKKK